MSAERIPAIDAGAEIDPRDVQTLYRLVIRLQYTVEAHAAEITRLKQKVSDLNGWYQP